MNSASPNCTVANVGICLINPFVRRCNLIAGSKIHSCQNRDYCSLTNRSFHSGPVSATRPVSFEETGVNLQIHPCHPSDQQSIVAGIASLIPASQKSRANSDISLNLRHSLSSEAMRSMFCVE